MEQVRLWWLIVPCSKELGQVGTGEVKCPWEPTSAWGGWRLDAHCSFTRSRLSSVCQTRQIVGIFRFLPICLHVQMTLPLSLCVMSVTFLGTFWFQLSLFISADKHIQRAVMQRNPLFLNPVWVLEMLLGVSYSLITCNSFFSEKVPTLKSELTYAVRAVSREENASEAPALEVSLQIWGRENLHLYLCRHSMMPGQSLWS